MAWTEMIEQITKVVGYGYGQHVHVVPYPTSLFTHSLLKLFHVILVDQEDE